MVIVFCIVLFLNQILSQCPNLGGSSCYQITDKNDCLNNNCMYVAGCCSPDLCDVAVNSLLDNVDLSSFGSFVNEECATKIACSQIDYCEIRNSKCLLSKCYENTPQSCPAGQCATGTCPVGKIYPDGVQCCNPPSVKAPDCYNNNKNTWENCSNTDGCAFYGGNCYPDVCLNIPKSIKIDPKLCGVSFFQPFNYDIPPIEQIKQFCVLEGNNYHQSRCYSLPAGHCYYKTSGCYYEAGFCPLNALSGEITEGCCAPEAAGSDSSACGQHSTAEACVAEAGECVWAVPRNLCLRNPCKTAVQGTCKAADGCKWVDGASPSQGVCYPSVYDPLDPTHDPTAVPSRAHVLSLPVPLLVLLLLVGVGVWW